MYSVLLVWIWAIIGFAGIRLIFRNLPMMYLMPLFEKEISPNVNMSITLITGIFLFCLVGFFVGLILERFMRKLHTNKTRDRWINHTPFIIAFSLFFYGYAFISKRLVFTQDPKLTNLTLSVAIMVSIFSAYIFFRMLLRISDKSRRFRNFLLSIFAISLLLNGFYYLLNEAFRIYSFHLFSRFNIILSLSWLIIIAFIYFLLRFILERGLFIAAFKKGVTQKVVFVLFLTVTAGFIIHDLSFRTVVPNIDEQERLFAILEDAKEGIDPIRGFVIGNSYMRGFLAPPNSVRRFSFSVPDVETDVYLCFSYGVLRNSWNVREKIRYRMDISSDNNTNPERVFSRTITPSKNKNICRKWNLGRLDLSSFKGSKINIDLTTELVSSKAPKQKMDIFSVWGVPFLVYPRTDNENDVILIICCTLRADHLNCFGYTKRKTSPNIDNLAKDGIIFRNAFCQSTWTYPSHNAIFFSRYPNQIVLKYYSKDPNQGELEKNETLTAVLKKNGYFTVAFLGGSTSVWVLDMAEEGNQDFLKDFDIIYVPGAGDIRDLEHNYEDFKNLTSKFSDLKMFAFIASSIPHQPFTEKTFVNKEKISSGNYKDYMLASYDGDIRYFDDCLGRYLGLLKEKGIFDNAVIVFANDHGEDIMDHFPQVSFCGHAHSFYDEVIRSPLIIRLPDDQKRESNSIDVMVELNDIAPTILGYLKIDKPDSFEGRSLIPLINGNVDMGDGEDIIYSEFHINGPTRRCVRTSRYKYIQIVEPLEGLEAHPEDPTFYRRKMDGKSRVGEFKDIERAYFPKMELYDVIADPEEKNNIAWENPEIVSKLKSAMITLGGSYKKSHLVDDFDPEVKEKLRALGYLQ